MLTIELHYIRDKHTEIRLFKIELCVWDLSKESINLPLRENKTKSVQDVFHIIYEFNTLYKYRYHYVNLKYLGNLQLVFYLKQERLENL